MTSNQSTSNNNGSVSYDHDQNTNVDTTRGNLLTDIQMSAETVPMPSTAAQMALNDVTRHEIATILERPVNLGTFAWTSNDIVIQPQLTLTDYDADTQNYIKEFNFPQDIFANSPIVIDKLKNYQYFKADIEIEIKINAQPFLQGALMLVYNPYYSSTGDFRRKGTRYLASQTSCPYKIVGVEDGNSLKLICPYANIYDMFDLGNSDNQFGTAFLYVFSALRGSEASASANYTVFARFVNPQFYVPTQNDVIASARDVHDIQRLEKKGYRVAQSAVSPSTARDTGEVETPGPVSKIASGVTTISDVLSGVPVIGKLASTVAWASRAIGATAATFGWSKPTSIQPQHKMVMKPNHTLIHTEGNDDAVTLALLQDNGIDGSSMMPENKDEMSFSYLLGRPNYFHAQTADTVAFSARKLITAWEVSPFSQYQYGNSEDSQTMFFGSFAYTSMMATLWRGTINYDIMVVKTPFHNGRFAVVFLPETNVADVPSELGELLNTNYNVICNLKDRQDEMGRTTFRVSVPFISNTPWRETYKRTTNTSNPGPDATTLDTKTGCLAIYSLVDLSNPPTTAGNVTFYVAHSAGEDYQLARPVSNITPGFQTRHAQSDIGTVLIPENENLLVPSHTTCDVTGQTTGEYFQSLRAFMKRFGKFASLLQIDDYVGLRTRTFSEDPTSGRRTLSRKNFTDFVTPTPFYMASFLFRFYNGSTQLKGIPLTPGVTGEAYVSFDENLDDQTTSTELESLAQPVYQQLQQVANAFEIRTPFYRGVRCDVVGSTQIPVLGDVRTNIRMRNLGGYGSSSATPLFEAAGDDFSFFFMVGPPPMSDVLNLKAPSVLPTGTKIQVDLSSITTYEGSTDSVAGRTITYDPTLVQDSVQYKISKSTLLTVPMVDINGNTTQIPVTDCEVTDPSNNTPTFRVPFNFIALDGAATKTLWQAIPPFEIVSNAKTN